MRRSLFMILVKFDVLRNWGRAAHSQVDQAVKSKTMKGCWKRNCIEFHSVYNTNQVFYVFKCIFSTWRLPFQIVGSQYVLTTLRIDGTNIHAFGTGERPICFFWEEKKFHLWRWEKSRTRRARIPNMTLRKRTYKSGKNPLQGGLGDLRVQRLPLVLLPQL